jgi:DNA end-binding protein Ku
MSTTIRSKVGARLGMAAGSFDVVTSVTDAKETALRTVCTGTEETPHAPAAVKQVYECPVDACDRKGKITDFSKAKEPSKNSFIVVPPEELENLQASAALKDQMVFAVYPRDQVETHVVPHGKPYYLRPSDATSAEPYALFRRIVEQAVDAGRVVLAIWSAKGAPVLWRLHVLNGVLAVQPLCWPNQLDAAPEVPDIDVSKYDGLIPSFIDAVSSDFKPEDFRDERADALQAFVATQTAVEGIEAPTQDQPTAQPVDLMAALAATVAASTPAKKAAAPRKRAARKAS